MGNEKINEKELEKTSGGYQALIEENKFTGKAIFLTQNEIEALEKAGLATKENSKTVIKPEKFDEAQKYLVDHKFKGTTIFKSNDNQSVSVNVLK